MKTVWDSYEWKGIELFNLLFWILAPSTLSGFGMFYIKTIILENSLSSGLFSSLLITSSITAVSLINQTRSYAHKLEQKEGDLHGEDN